MPRLGRAPSTRPGQRVAALLAAGLALVACGRSQAPPAPPRAVVLVVLDTLRADGLSVYGNPRPSSPHLDALAEEGVLFEQATSHASWTLPGFVGLLSGRYPSKQTFRGARLQHSLLEPLRSAGFATAAFTEGAYVSARFGMDRGFDHFWERPGETRLVTDEEVPESAVAGGVEATFDAAIAWLETNQERPFFLMVHTYEVHLPYRRGRWAGSLPRGVLGESYEVTDAQAVREGRVDAGPVERAYVRALYDGGVHAADAAVGRLLAALDAAGLADDSVVAVTSDHGEDLGDRNPRHLGVHQHHLHDELLRVPLIIRDRRTEWPVRRVGTQVRLVDVMPTLLDLAGVEVPSELEGRSLAPLMRGEEAAGRPAYAELRSQGRSLIALRTDTHKVIVEEAGGPVPEVDVSLYDLDHDPDERFDLAAVEAAEARRMLALLRAQRSSLARSGVADLDVGRDADPALRDQLRALGYVSD